MKTSAVVAAALISVGVYAVVTTASQKVTSISPTYGGKNGQVLVNIYGEGFSEDPFTYGNGNEDKGNAVSFNADGTSIPCDIHPNGCTKTQLQCYTRKMERNKVYTVSVKVDGKLVTDVCTNGRCNFTPREWATPKLDSISPRSGKSGVAILESHGLIFSTRFGSNTQTSPNGNEKKILRFKTDNQPCDPFKEKDVFYKLELDSTTSNYGTYQCKTTGTFVGGVKHTILLEQPYGLGVPVDNLMYVSRTQKPQAFQFYTDITNVSPATGSTEGGLVITAEGDFYSQGKTYSLAECYVGDLKCEIVSLVEDTSVSCLVPAKPAETPEWYAGNRGVLVESFTSPSFSTLDGAIDATDSASSVTWYDETRYCGIMKWTRMRFIFEAPATGQWYFFINGAQAKLDIDGSSGTSSGQWAYAGMKTFWKVGEKVKMVAVAEPGTSSESCVSVKAQHLDTTISALQTGLSYPELQSIKITSEVKKEIFTLKFSDFSSQSAVNMQQKICETASGSGSARLKVYGASTPTVDLSNTKAVKDALNQLPFLRDDEKFKVEESTAGCILITLASVRGNIQKIEVIPPEAATVETTLGKSNNLDFAFQYNGIPSPLITYDSSDKPAFAQTIQGALEAMSGVQCPAMFTTGPNGFLHQGFEEGPSESGTAKIPAFCGRFSCKNCKTLYPIPHGSSDPLALTSLHKWFCFAAKGLDNDFILLKFKDKDDIVRSHWFTMTDLMQDGDWWYKCIDIKTASSKWQNTVNLVEAFVHNPSGDPDFYVDDLLIAGTSPLESLSVATDFAGLRMPIAYPNSDYPTTMESVSVVYDSTNDLYEVSLAPYDCGYDFKLVTMAESTVVSASSSFVTSTLDERTGKMETNRTSEGQKPIKGTFKISFDGSSSQAIEVFGSTADKLKQILEGIENIGTLTVTLTDASTCANMEYLVEFSDSAGNKPLMTVTDEQLTWPDSGATAEVVAKRDGFLLYEPLLGDIALTYSEEPQVRVLINSIPTKCEMSDHKCSFSWSTDATPTIIGLNIDQGNLGDTLTITGTSFSTTTSDITVTIGGVTCVVTSSTATEIQCTVGSGPPKTQPSSRRKRSSSASTYPVIVNVAGKGIASGNKQFKYTVDMADITPKSSTLGGYTTLTVTGKGFSDDTVVNFGNVECDKTDSEIPTKIFCTVPPFSDLSETSTQTVTVSATTNGVTMDSTLTFTYNPISAEITAVTTDSKPTVLGGTVVTITGTAMGEEGKVLIADTELNVTSRTNEEIQAVIPQGIKAGKNLPVLVFYGTDGVIIKKSPSSTIPTIDIILEVTNVYPHSGSKHGGTTLTITGEGFGVSKEDTEVLVGDYPCHVIDMIDSEIKCDIASTAKTHVITNDGTTGEGYPYAFSQTVATVKVGDAIRFTWTTPEFLTDLKLGVSETATLDAMEDKEGGFNSGPHTKEGSAVMVFTELRDHFFWCYPDYSRKYFRMTVKVEPRLAEVKSISVRVAGQEAYYDVTSGQSDPTDSSGCTLADSDIEGCDTETATVPDDTKFSFNFSCSKTPIVYSVSLEDVSSTVKRSALITTPLSISGKGFGANCANEAKIGGCACKVEESTTASFKCTPVPSCEYDTGVYQEFSLRVNQYGNALINIEKTIDRSIALLPLITEIMPTSGSGKGGTIVTISGTAFTDDKTKAQVTFGGIGAVCSEVVKSKLVCTTPFKSSAGSVPIAVTIGGVTAVCDTGLECNFNYNSTLTPVVSSVSPTSVSSSTNLQFTGEKLGAEASQLSITVGGETCGNIVIITNDIKVNCSVNALPAGPNEVKLVVSGVGDASTDVKVTGTPVVSPSPETGSVYGKTILTLTGHGFVDGLSIQVDGVDICQKIDVKSLIEVECVTKAHAAKAVKIIVTSNDVTYDAVDFEFSLASSPTIDSIDPTNGAVGTTVTISGKNFGSNPDDIKVYIDDAECTGVSLSGNDITCTTGAKSSGTYDVVVDVAGKGQSNSTTFTYEVTVSSFYPTSGTSGGNQLLTVSGNGFTESMEVKVCTGVCKFHSLPSSSEYICVTPKGTAGPCKVTVKEGTASPIEATGDYTYADGVGPTVTKIEPPVGGTGGNTQVTITGTGFSATASEVSVDIDGVACVVTSSTTTEIVCRTGAHSGTKLCDVDVTVNDDRAFASEDDILKFHYADTWGSTYTWNGEPVPGKGEVVVIPEGQSVLIDEDTEVIAMLLIQGGDVIFADTDVTLRAGRILITNGGKLQIGTKDEPFTKKAVIELHGHPREMELPVYGSKFLAVREGTLELHGRVITNTWTMLAETAEEKATTITVLDSVDDWEVNDEIVIASTGGHNSFNQNAKRKITAKDGKTLTLDEPLDYKYLGNEEEYTDANGKKVILPYRAEVGLLTRSIVIKGSNEEDWEIEIEKCPDGFDPGEFATQTCFQGRFGDEVGSDDFGGQVMIHQPADASEVGQIAQAHIEYTEFTRMGQAFRLGRYPVHFHLNGKMDESYIRGCSIHKTFNRAINIHGVHDMIVEFNVVYNVMGGALFLEDGIETGNTFYKNLVVFVKASTSLLNDDITPAAFWATNPDNIYELNHAAGGTHFGWWYRMHEFPDGPSYTKSVCPRHVPIRKFTNNTAHSNGWFGLWVFQEYYPIVDSSCNAGKGPAPAVIESLIAWNNKKGIELVTVGAIHLKGAVLANNHEAGYEMKQGKNALSRSSLSAMVNDTVIVARATSVSNQNEDGKTSTGIVAPFTNFFQVHNTKFIGCTGSSVAFKGTSIDGTCSDNCGSWFFQTSNLGFENCDNRVQYRWAHEIGIEDLDGTLCGTGAKRKILPKGGDAWPTTCTESCSDYVMTGGSSVPALVCPFDEQFFSFGFNNAKPSSLWGKELNLTNQYGHTIAVFRDKRVEFKNGWTAMLVGGITTTLTFKNADAMTNISFTGKVGNMHPGGCTILRVKTLEKPDSVSTDGGKTSKQAASNAVTCDMKDLETGNWSHDENQYVSVAVVNDGDSYADIAVNLKFVKCYFKDCIVPPPADKVPPPTQRPDSQKWEKNIWDFDSGTNLMTASIKNESGSGPPTTGQNVLIEKDMWVLISQYKVPPLGIVKIKGGLEIDYEFEYDYVFEADIIVILCGRFHVGWLDNPMNLPTVSIIMNGDKDSRMFTEIDGYPIGNKALGVFGGFEVHGRNVGTSWTRLAETVSKDDKTLTVRNKDDISKWNNGDELIITSTSNNKAEAERVKIKSINKDTGKINLEDDLKYRHSGGVQTVNGRDIDLGAAIGILTRSVTIQGQLVNGEADAWGGRILTSFTAVNGESCTGYSRLHDVLLRYMGQDGFTESYDPRPALAYLDTGSVSDIKPSEVLRSAFVDLYNGAFAAYGADDFKFEDNVVLNALGNGVVTESDNTIVKKNLIVNSQWTGSYNGRSEAFTERYEFALTAMGSTNLQLHNNYIAGSERIGYNVPGVACDVTEIMYSNNVAVGNIMGVGILPDPVLNMECTRLSGFTVFKNFDFGIYYVNKPSLEVSDNVYVDENFALFPMVVGPDPLTHEIGNKFVAVKNSIAVGTSSVTKCDEETTPSGKYLDLSKDHRSSRGPGGERLFFVIGVFSGGSNKCPEKPCAKIMAYNAISGETVMSDITFVNFNGVQSGCTAAFAMSTLQKNDDANHPVLLRRITLSNVQESNKVSIHRPNVEKINPADCVDMDCDALKKVLVKDEDGTFMGTPGSIISESEFEWDGDRRRGLGDYRVPKDALTTLGGDVLTVDEVAQNGTGIVRTKACVKKTISDGKSAYYWCPGVDYEMLLIESLDDDTETRRLSPIAFFSGGYVDLMNGPQDHGWCNGYTCQKRISTFLAMIMSGKSVEIYFSSTQPDKIRFALIRAAENQCAVVALYYLNPNRIDVYINDGRTYKDPKNKAEDENGNFRLENDPNVDYIPTCADDHGSNYIDREARLIHFVVKGGTKTIILKRANVIVVAFGFPAVKEEDFFNNNRIIQNLAALLDVAVSRIRILKVIPASSKRKRRSTEGITVELEIGDPPAETADEGTEEVTEPASNLMNFCQEGAMGSLLDEDVTCEEIIVGDSTYTPVQPEELRFTDQISPQHEGVPFSVQPRIRAYDTNGVVIENLGIEESPWEITASLRSCDPACGRANAVLSGTLTVASSNGWFNFTDLQISHKGDGYIIDFEITSPTGTNLTLESSQFSVAGLPMTAGVYAMTSGDIAQNSVFSLTLDLRDNTTNIPIPDITWRDHTSFDVTCGLVVDSATGSFAGTLSTSFDSGTGRASFDDLTFSGYGLITISCLVVSTPEEYEFYTFQKVFFLGSHQEGIVVEALESIGVRYQLDYDATLPTQAAAAQLAQATIEVFTMKYQGVIIKDYSVSKGSIIVTFTVEGQSINVTSTKQDMCEELSSGMEVTVGGTTLTLDRYMTVDGVDYYTTCGVKEEDDGGLHPAFIALIVILCVLVIGIVVFVLIWRFKIRPKSKTHDRYLTDNGRTVFLGAQNQKIQDILYKQKGDKEFRNQASAPITTLYDETPGFMGIRKSPLPPKQEDLARGITPTDM